MVFLLAMTAAAVVAGKIFLSNNNENKKQEHGGRSDAMPPKDPSPEWKEEEHE